MQTGMKRPGAAGQLHEGSSSTPFSSASSSDHVDTRSAVGLGHSSPTRIDSHRGAAPVDVALSQSLSPASQYAIVCDLILAWGMSSMIDMLLSCCSSPSIPSPPWTSKA